MKHTLKTSTPDIFPEAANNGALSWGVSKGIGLDDRTLISSEEGNFPLTHYKYKFTKNI